MKIFDDILPSANIKESIKPIGREKANKYKVSSKPKNTNLKFLKINESVKNKKYSENIYT